MKLPMVTLILFCISVGLISAILIILDIISESKEPYEAILTLEVALLYIVNVIIASLITFVLLQTGRIQPGFLAWIGVVLGYPLLMHTKLFSIKRRSKKKLHQNFLSRRRAPGSRTLIKNLASGQ